MDATLAAPNAAAGIVARAEIAENPAAVYLRRLAPGSRRVQASALASIAGRLVGAEQADPLTFDWALLRYQHAQALRADLAARFAPATANRMLAALKGVLREAWRLGQLDAEAFHRAADLEAVRGSRLPRGRGLTAGEMRALFDACRLRGLLGARDAALLAVGYVGGLRRAEIVGLDRADFNAETGALRVRAGKGNKDRIAYLDNGALEALRAWAILRGDAEGPLFLAVAKGGRLGVGRLTAAAILKACEALAALAGVARFTPHDLRRSCASDMLDAGVDLPTVADHLGHAKVETTRRYDRRPDERKRRAVRMLHVPYLSGAVAL